MFQYFKNQIKIIVVFHMRNKFIYFDVHILLMSLRNLSPSIWKMLIIIAFGSAGIFYFLGIYTWLAFALDPIINIALLFVPGLAASVLVSVMIWIVPAIILTIIGVVLFVLYRRYGEINGDYSVKIKKKHEYTIVEVNKN